MWEDVDDDGDDGFGFPFFSFASDDVDGDESVGGDDFHRVNDDGGGGRAAAGGSERGYGDVVRSIGRPLSPPRVDIAASVVDDAEFRDEVISSVRRSAQDLRRRTEIVQSRMGTPALCRGAQGEELCDAGAVNALLDALQGLATGTATNTTMTTTLVRNTGGGNDNDDGKDGLFNYFLPSLFPDLDHSPPLAATKYENNDAPDDDLLPRLSKDARRQLAAALTDRDAAALDLAAACLGSLRDLSCGSSGVRSALLLWRVPEDRERQRRLHLAKASTETTKVTAAGGGRTTTAGGDGDGNRRSGDDGDGEGDGNGNGSICPTADSIVVENRCIVDGSGRGSEDRNGSSLGSGDVVVKDGIHVISRYVLRYHGLSWETVLHQPDDGGLSTERRSESASLSRDRAHTERGVAELRVLTAALGAVRNASHSSPESCGAFFQLGIADALVWRLMRECDGDGDERIRDQDERAGEGRDKGENGERDRDKRLSGADGVVAPPPPTTIRALPDASRPWREGCFRAAGALINIAEKCPPAARKMGSNRDLILLLIETWGGAKKRGVGGGESRVDNTKDGGKIVGPLLHLGLAAVLRAARDGALAGGLDDAMESVLEGEAMRKEIARRREEDRKRRRAVKLALAAGAEAVEDKGGE